MSPHTPPHTPSPSRSPAPPDSRPDSGPAVACSLSRDGALDQLGEWAALMGDAIGTARADGHLSMVVGIDRRDVVEDLVARERSCCSFLDIQVATDEDAATITVTIASSAADGRAVVSLIGRVPDVT